MKALKGELMYEYIHKEGFLRICETTFGKTSDNFKAIKQIANECTLSCEPSRVNLLYSERRSIATLYRRWLEDRRVADCPENLIAFLYSNGLLDVKSVVKFVQKEKTICQDT